MLHLNPHVLGVENIGLHYNQVYIVYQKKMFNSLYFRKTSKLVFPLRSILPLTRMSLV